MFSGPTAKTLTELTNPHTVTHLIAAISGQSYHTVLVRSTGQPYYQVVQYLY